MNIDTVGATRIVRPYTGCLLTKGQIAFYDLEDASKVEQYKWRARWNKSTKSYYAHANTSGSHSERIEIQMSRLIMGLEKGDHRQVDHVDHNTLDNRKSNLRIVTPSQNMQNLRNVKGCHFYKRLNKWRAQIRVDGHYITLGHFDTEAEAHQVYLAARKGYGHIDSPGYHTDLPPLKHIKHETKGYTWHKQRKKWNARIGVDSKLVDLGFFDSELAASQAYLNARKVYRGY